MNPEGSDEKYISLAECKHGHIYYIDSRNLTYGIFNKETKGFTGIRTKFDDVYLFEEYHWDTGAPYGTAKPLEDIADATRLLEEESKSALLITLLKLCHKQQNTKIVELQRDLWHEQYKSKKALSKPETID